MHEKGNYGSLSPFFGTEADIVYKIFSNKKDGAGSLVSSRKYSSKIQLQIRPKERWGSCHTEYDDGYTNTVKYQHHLKACTLRCTVLMLVKDIASSTSKLVLIWTKMLRSDWKILIPYEFYYTMCVYILL